MIRPRERPILGEVALENARAECDGRNRRDGTRNPYHQVRLEIPAQRVKRRVDRES